MVSMASDYHREPDCKCIMCCNQVICLGREIIFKVRAKIFEFLERRYKVGER